MHPYLLRLNSVLTLAVSGLAILAALAALTDYTRQPVVIASASVATYDGLQPEYSDDRAWLTVDLNVDLRPLWHWNTKQVCFRICPRFSSLRQVFLYLTAEYVSKKNHLNQVVLWSRIMERKAKAKINGPVRVVDPYVFTDQGTGLRNQTFNLTVAWESVPNVGLQHRDSHTFSGFQIPGDYFRTARSQTSRWRQR